MMTDAPRKIGFVGLGPVGTAMADGLLRAGHQLYVYTRGRVPRAIAESRATLCTTALGVAQRADVVFVMVDDGAAAALDSLDALDRECAVVRVSLRTAGA